MRRIFFCFFLLLFITGCVTFPTTKPKDDDKGQGSAFTGIIGGKGVQVGFAPNNPPLDKIDGSFGLAIKFFNFNREPATIDSFTVGSTGNYDGFSNFVDESMTIEGALVRETGRGIQFLGPGTEYSYQGQGQRQRDGSIDYGEFQFSTAGPGAGTSFYVDMLIQDYLSKSLFQFCAFDVGASQTLGLGGCPLTQTMSGNQLGLSYQHDPVTVTRITRNLASSREGVKVSLDILIEDRSEKKIKASSGKAFEQGNIPLTNGQEQFFFELEATTGGAIRFVCDSDQERYATGKTSSFLTLVLQQGKANAHCVGYASLFEERKDYQYEVTLRYPYRQIISTSYIPIRSTEKQPFSN